MTPGEYPDKPENTENEFFGNGWSVKKVGEQYFLAYISGELHGKLREVEISGEDYLNARNGATDLDALCIKYGVS